MTTDPTTLSLADLAAAVVRLGAHRANCALAGSNVYDANGNNIAINVDTAALDLLLAAANRLPGVVADLANRDGQLVAVKGERDGLHAELKRVVDYAIDEAGMPVTAMLGPDAPSRCMRKLHEERDAAVQRAAAAEADTMARIVAYLRTMASGFRLGGDVRRGVEYIMREIESGAWRGKEQA